MSKYPLLDALRAARAHREAEVRAPVERQLADCRLHARELAEAKARLEELIRSPIAKEIIARFGHALGRELPPLIWKAIDEAIGRSPDKDFVEVPFSVQELRGMRPDDMEKRVLDFYSRHIEKRTEIEARAIPHDCALRVRVSIPTFSFEQAVHSPMSEIRFRQGSARE